jgi:hypothetical protein
MPTLTDMLAATNAIPERIQELKPWLNPDDQETSSLVLDNPAYVEALFGVPDFQDKLTSPCSPQAWRQLLHQWAIQVAQDILTRTAAQIRRSPDINTTATALADLRTQFADTGRSHVVEDLATLLLSEAETPSELDLGGFAEQIGLTPVERGNLIVMAGPTGFGKTAAALRITLERALDGHRTHYVSLEMSRSQLQKRFLSLITQTPLQQLGAYDRVELAGAVEAIKTNIMIHYFAGSLIKLKDALDAYVSEGDLVVIDHALLIEIPSNHNRTEAYGEITRWLKGFSRMRDISTLLLTQLRRDTTDGAPGLADLSWSSSFGWDADIVVMLYDDASGISHSKIAKSRQGDQGIYMLDREWQHTLTLPSER